MSTIDAVIGSAVLAAKKHRWDIGVLQVHIPALVSCLRRLPPAIETGGSRGLPTSGSAVPTDKSETGALGLSAAGDRTYRLPHREGSRNPDIHIDNLVALPTFIG